MCENVWFKSTNVCISFGKSNRESPDMAPTKEKFGQITYHFEFASADNFLTNLIVGQIM